MLFVQIHWVQEHKAMYTSAPFFFSLSLIVLLQYSIRKRTHNFRLYWWEFWCPATFQQLIWKLSKGAPTHAMLIAQCRVCAVIIDGVVWQYWMFEQSLKKHWASLKYIAQTDLHKFLLYRLVWILCNICSVVVLLSWWAHKGQGSSWLNLLTYIVVFQLCSKLIYYLYAFLQCPYCGLACLKCRV
jgi:hypothetical protein